MATSKIKKDDLVQVIAGKDKGATGKVLSVDTKNNKSKIKAVLVHRFFLYISSRKKHQNSI